MKKICFIILLMLVCRLEVLALPKLYFEGNINNMNDKQDVRNIKVQYESEDLNFEGFAKLKIQGTSSLAYDKKNYTIKFYKDDSYDDKLKIDFDWGKQSKYCLKANWIDKTHARNIISARIASKVAEKYGVLKDTPNFGVIDGFPIEIYINDEFLGLYTLNIPKDAWMFNMDENNPDNIVLLGKIWSNSVNFLEPASWDGSWEVEVGKKDEATLEKFNRLINFIKIVLMKSLKIKLTITLI